MEEVKGNYNKVDHMIAAKRAWSLYKKKKKLLFSHGPKLCGLENPPP